MERWTRRVLITIVTATVLTVGTISIQPAAAAPRAFSSPITGSFTSALVPVPLAFPALATFDGTVDDSARTAKGTIAADPIEFDIDPSSLPVDIPDLPDAPISAKIKLVTPGQGLTGSWTAGGAATMAGTVRVDLGDTTIGGVKIGLLFGCYYDMPVELVGSVNPSTGVLDVSDDEVTVSGITGLCAALLAPLDQYIKGQTFALSLRIELGAMAPPVTTPSTPSTTAPSTTRPPWISSGPASTTTPPSTTVSVPSTVPSTPISAAPAVTIPGGTPDVIDPDDVLGSAQRPASPARPAASIRGTAPYTG